MYQKACQYLVFWGGLLAYVLVMTGLWDPPERVTEGAVILTLTGFLMHGHNGLLPLGRGSEVEQHDEIERG